ncbi:nuclease-related domain-containing protein [Alkalicoccobacillus murimartini]|uniref:nuclease-related domain-containing protein n=1 Tax=Alkalicoccobacillus murimartini TaxID=171685 RepID=UPI0027D85169|nr:nuclease-related domain-containing protein [Alkalicoccobacillus murimartini]
MAHIIRIMEYRSRYQTDLQRYPSQFTRLKKERWHYLHESWKREFAETLRHEYEDLTESSPLAGMWSKAVTHVRKWTNTEQNEVDEKQREHEAFQRVKKQFKDEMYTMQLEWAGVFLEESEEQVESNSLFKNTWLKWLALDLPDNCFIFYKPIMYVKKAEIELDILLITPTELVCMTILKGDPLSVFEASSERYWIEYVNKERHKRLSPLPSLERMERVVKAVLDQHEIDMPIRSLVVAPDAIIDQRTSGLKFDCVDKRTFQSWKNKLSQSTTPLKYHQVKAAEYLLNVCEPKHLEQEEA